MLPLQLYSIPTLTRLNAKANRLTSIEVGPIMTDEISKKILQQQLQQNEDTDNTADNDPSSSSSSAFSSSSPFPISPAAYFSCFQLTFLDLSENRLTQLPQQFAHLTELKQVFY